MEIKIKRKSRTTDTKTHTKRPHILIIFFLAIIFALAGVNLLKAVSSDMGIKPFGFLNEVVAGGSSGESSPPGNSSDSNGASSSSNMAALALQEKYNIRDNTDRCIPINPANGAPMSNGTSMYIGKGGLNQGNLVASGGDDLLFIKGQTSANPVNLDMGYVLRIALGPEDVGSTGNFIKEANDNGLVPVVRLCYSPEAGGNCNFDLNVPADHPNSIAKFYRDIYNNLGDSFEAVFVTGPNEPGTASEMTGFKIANGDYATLVARTNDVARAIQDIRGSGIHLAPAIFNTSTNLSGRYPTGGDFEAYNANGIDWSLFDYILANMYDTKSNNSFEEYKRTGVQSFAAQNGLKVILTEFGLFDKETPGVKDQFMTNFSNFCAENNVDGILFFRSIEELGQIEGPNADTLPVADIAAMTKSCVRLRDWLNCNFDSAIYPDNPEKISMVSDSLAGSNPSCIVREETPSKGAALLVACSGDSCSAKMIKTVRADLPIKHFGSNSSFGTKTKQFSPISAEIAAMTDIAPYDVMNQFAGELEGSDGSRYAMPLLGSAINSTAELSKYMSDFGRFPYLQSFPSPGSFSSNIKDEIRTEVDRNIGGLISNPKSIYVEENGVRFIPDERVVNIDGNNMDKTDVNALKDIRDYNPYAATNFSKLPNSCSGDMKYLKNPDDYIPGPEVLVEEKTLWSGSGGELCRRYGERNNGAPKDVEMQTGSGLNCRVNPNRTVPIAGGTALVRCGNVVFCNFGAGNCTINPAYSSCIDYSQAATDKVYMYANDYASIPNYKIKDVWDALSMQYQILQDSLKTRGLKMIFQENIGWRAQYQSAIRDANKSADAGTNLYSSSPEELEFSQNGISGSAFEPNLFDNNYLFAKGKSIVRTEQYYDWLGYLDIIQEMRMIYLNSTSLGAEERIENPYFQREGPNSERPEINLAGLASQVSSFPFITCDQVELCKNKDKLISDLGQEGADKLCPFEPIKASAKLTCVTDSSDTRFEDGLQKQLCLRGYSSEGCKAYQCLPGESPTPDPGEDGASIDSIQLTDGAVAFTVNLNQFDIVASNPNDSVKSVETFANENSVDFAINTNFFTFGTEETYAPEGLVAGKGTVEFNPTSRGVEAALVFYTGDPTGGNPEIKVLSKTDKLALIEIDGTWGGKAEEKLASIRNNITISVSGLPILLHNGVRADTSQNYQGISNNFSPRTIIGWNSKGELVSAVLNSADFNGMVNTAASLDMVTAIGMDGGGSSQLYSRNGFPSEVDSSKLKLNSTVYWPGRPNETVPRNVIAYLGARPKNGSSDFNSSATFASNSSSSQGEPLNISLSYPTSSKNVVSQGSYGCEIRRGENLDQCHTGIDFALNSGTPVLAAASGRIIYATWDPEGGAYGNSIRIAHAGGTSTLYAHLSEVLVTSGQEVKKGELIGYVGNTGNSTGPHLHFELRRNTTCQWDGMPEFIGRCTVDPIPYLTGRIIIDDEVPRCLEEPDFNTPAIPGVLSCTIDMLNTSNMVDWAGSTNYLNVYIQSYNLDSNQSFTWIGSKDMTSDANPETRNDRIRVTDFVIQKSIEAGLSPKFVIDLWLEETGGSALGTKALGCGVYVNSYSSIPFGQGADAMIEHMRQQIECLASVVEKTSNFVEFMCTYSGEPPVPGTSVKPGSVRTCNQFTNNPNFPVNICKIYAEL